MTNWIAKFFGLEGEPKRVLYLAKIAAIFMPLASISFMMSTTFYAVFVARTLVPEPAPLEAGMAVVGVLAGISMITQSVLDYPTGGIGDWIGQRWILCSAFLFFGASMFFTAFAQPSFMYFVIIYLLQAIGSAQMSGAIAAWFDVNYRAVAKDPERKAYSVAQGRMGMLFQIVSTASLIPGALYAALYGRQGVFFFQAILCVLLGIGSLLLFRDFPEVKKNRPRRSLRAYYSLLKDGLKFTVSSRMVFLFLIGWVLMISTITVWGNLVLFTVYYKYLYEDLAVAMFRTVLFATGVFWTERAGVWTRSLSTSKWIPRSRLLQTCGPVFYIVLATITLLIPPITVPIPFPLMFFQISSVLICFAFIFTGLFSSASGLMTQRLTLDLVPDRIRNGIYSLIPTLTLLFAFPQILFFAMILATQGLVPVLVGLCVISIFGLILLYFGLRKAPPRVPEEEIIVIPIPPGEIP